MGGTDLLGLGCATRRALPHLPSIPRMEPTPAPITILATDGVELAGELWLPTGATAASTGAGPGHEPRLLGHAGHGPPPLRRRLRRRRASPCASTTTATSASPAVSPARPSTRGARPSTCATVVGWLADRPEVDPDRLGAWGSSFSGGEVLALGAVDRAPEGGGGQRPVRRPRATSIRPTPRAIERRFEAMSEVLGGERARPGRHRDRPDASGARAGRRRPGLPASARVDGVVPGQRTRRRMGEPVHAHDHRGSAVRPVRLRPPHRARRRC